MQGPAQGYLCRSAVVIQLTLPVGEHTHVQREDVVILSHLGIARRILWEGILWEPGSLSCDGRDIQVQAIAPLGIVAALHCAYTVLHAVAGIAADFQRVGRPLRDGHRRKVVDFHSFAAVGQTKNQPSVLKIEELAASVRGAHQEVVERLVILYQIRLNELPPLVTHSVGQMPLAVDVRLNQGDTV